MSAIHTVTITEVEAAKILELVENHFTDLKAIEIAPSKLTRSLSAFSNAEGGELFIGIDEDKSANIRSWRGFNAPEQANSHLQVFEQLFPLGEDFSYTFLESLTQAGYVLRIEVKKTRDIKYASNEKVYIRR